MTHAHFLGNSRRMCPFQQNRGEFRKEIVTKSRNGIHTVKECGQRRSWDDSCISDPESNSPSCKPEYKDGGLQNKRETC